MGLFSSKRDYLNVFKHPWTGRLDRLSNGDGERDAALIREYIRIEKQTKASAPRRPTPAIAREVLLKVWEAPRIGFHSQELGRSAARLDLRSKLLLIPWSEEAAKRFNKTRSAKGLVLEHVTPIDWMWRSLTKLDDDFQNPNSYVHPTPGWGQEPPKWSDWAAGYLHDHWMVTALTQEQATAIDSYGSERRGSSPTPSSATTKPSKQWTRPARISHARSADPYRPSVPQGS